MKTPNVGQNTVSRSRLPSVKYLLRGGLTAGVSDYAAIGGRKARALTEMNEGFGENVWEVPCAVREVIGPMGVPSQCHDSDPEPNLNPPPDTFQIHPSESRRSASYLPILLPASAQSVSLQGQRVVQ